MRGLLATALVLALGCAGDDTEDPYRAVDVELLRGDRQDTDPYVGVDTVIVTMRYPACLVEFYADHPELRQDGPDGDWIFDHWQAVLCEESTVECSVNSIAQSLDVDVPTLSVQYWVNGPLEGRMLAVGPFPTAKTAGCAAEIELLSIETDS